MVESRSNREEVIVQKVVLGVGFLVQGLRCFPWRAIKFFLKDDLGVDASTLQALNISVNLPLVAKPLYGIISDVVYIRGQHRIPYIAFGAFLQAVSWLAIAILPTTNINHIFVYLLLVNLGTAIADVANDAIVAQLSKKPSSQTTSSSTTGGELQSFVWMASSLGGVFGNLLSGVALDRFSPQTNFLMFGVLVTIQLLLTLNVPETSLHLPPNPNSRAGINHRLSDLWLALKKPEIAYSILWFIASNAMIPDLGGTMFYYRTQHLKLDKSILGLSKVFGQAVMLLWSFIYNRRLKSVPPRTLIFNIQVTLAIFTILSALSVEGLFTRFGIPESVHAVVFSGFVDVLTAFKILPFAILMAQRCPPGCEGSLMAFVMSSIELALIVSGYWGIAVSSFFGVTRYDFLKLPQAISVQAAFTLFPLFLSSWILDDSKSKRKRRRE